MKKEIKMYVYNEEGKIVKFKQLKRKKNSRRLSIDLKENIKIKLEEISKKENKSQIEIVSELIRDYEIYKRTIFSISDDVKLMVKCFEMLNESFTEELRMRAKDEIIKDEKKILTYKNNFDDNVYNLEKNKYYIDDEEFDIFYEISNKNEYRFEFIEK